MSITARCRCGKAFRAKEELAGKQVPCPSCGSTIVIPNAVETPKRGIVITCQCGGRFMVDSSMEGQSVLCPRCSAQICVLGADAMMPVAKRDSRAASNPDPFASVGSNPLQDNFFNDAKMPAMSMPSAPFAGSAASSAKTKKKSSRNVLLIVLGVIGGGFLLMFLVCAGFLVVGFQRAKQQLAMEQQLASGNFPLGENSGSGGNSKKETLLEARSGFVTRIVKSGENAGPPDDPMGTDFELKQYPSPVGSLAAYLTKDPRDGKKHPAIIWITGGDTNSIGDVWSPQDRSNDQSASPFRKAGVVMMFPSLRGGNANPGRREGFYGEVDDILAAAKYLEKIPYVDPQQIYLGGHSTGGTMVMVVAACSNRFKAIFALGPVAAASQYGGMFIYCNPKDMKEIALRSPILWLHCVKSPLYVVEGENDGNWDAVEQMVKINTNPQIRFFKAPRHDHFSIIAPFAETVAQQILSGNIAITEQTIQQL